MPEIALDETDRLIVNGLQGGFPVTARPYRTAARRLGLTEVELIARLKRLLEAGVLSRFGPLYRIERAGGEYVLCAMRVPRERLDGSSTIAQRDAGSGAQLRARPRLQSVVRARGRNARARSSARNRRSRAETGLPVFAFPKLREYFLDLHLTV